MKFTIFLLSIVVIAFLGTAVISPIQVRAGSCSVSAIAIKDGNPVTAVSPGSAFDIKIRVSSDMASHGLDFVLTWDPSLVECTSAEKGPYYTDWAGANGQSVFWNPSVPDFDNVHGRFPLNTSTTGQIPLSVILMGAFGAGVTGEGDVYILHMTAKNEASGTANFSLSSVVLIDATENSDDMHAVVNNGAVSINSQGTEALTLAYNPASGLSGNGVTLNGNLISLGGASSVEVSFEYGPDTNYGSTTAAQTMTATGAFIAAITGLTGNTTYHYRAKAVNDSNTTFGGDQTFHTLFNISATTGTVTDVLSNRAVLTANLSSLGGAEGVYISFEYGTTTGYGSATTRELRNEAGNCSKAISDLAANTAYHYRVRADAGTGATAVTSFGTDLTFTTLTADLLAVTSISANNISSSGATLNGNLSSLGSDTSADVSFEYGTTTSYGSNTTAQSLTATGTFSVGLTGLTAGTTYHFRAKAVGSTTVYGSDLSFNTLAANAPLAVSSSNATNIAATGTTLNGNLSSLGSDTSVSVSFEYGTTTSYGSNTTAQSLTATGTFSAGLTGLTAGNTYHFRAKALGATTAYGSDLTFTTIPAVDTTVLSSTSAQPIKTATAKPTVSSKASTAKNVTSSQALDIAGSIDGAGLFLEEWSGNLNYAGKQIRVEIENGTRGMLNDGSPLTEIWIAAPTAAPVTPDNGRFINYFELEPSGAIFSSPIEISLSYDAAQIGNGEDAGNLAIGYFNPETGKWEECDYTLDTENRVIKANLSHFSLYGVIIKNNAGMLGAAANVGGFGWSTAGTIIVVEVLIGCVIVYLFLRRKQPLVPAAAAAGQVVYAQAAELAPTATTATATPRESGRVIWDDILRDSKERGAPFKTQLEIIGGKVIIPGDGKSADIELINMPDSRILIALEYDPEVSPRGKAKIVVLGTANEYEKSKEMGK